MSRAALPRAICFGHFDACRSSFFLGLKSVRGYPSVQTAILMLAVAHKLGAAPHSPVPHLALGCSQQNLQEKLQNPPAAVSPSPAHSVPSCATSASWLTGCLLSPRAPWISKESQRQFPGHRWVSVTPLRVCMLLSGMLWALHVVGCSEWKISCRYAGLPGAMQIA